MLENYPRDELFHTPAEELAPIAESRLRQGLMMADGSFMPLVTQPLTLSLLVLSVLLLFWPFFRSWRMSRR